VPGWASVPITGLQNGTTGGGQDAAQAVIVSTMAQFKSYAEGTGSAIILIQPGTYTGTLSPTANKTVIGLAPGVLSQGNVRLSGTDFFNIIIRNLAVRGNPCASYNECKAGDDAVAVENGAHHVWLDHVDIAGATVSFSP
jgi:pectate lyase